MSFAGPQASAHPRAKPTRIKEDAVGRSWLKPGGQTIRSVLVSLGDCVANHGREMQLKTRFLMPLSKRRTGGVIDTNGESYTFEYGLRRSNTRNPRTSSSIPCSSVTVVE